MARPGKERAKGDGDGRSGSKLGFAPIGAAVAVALLALSFGVANLRQHATLDALDESSTIANAQGWEATSSSAEQSVPTSEQRTQLATAASNVGSGAGSSCHDTSAECARWAQTGECTSNAPFMLQSCARSCGTCVPPGADDPATNCNNANENCAQWAAAGECARSALRSCLARIRTPADAFSPPFCAQATTTRDT